MVETMEYYNVYCDKCGRVINRFPQDSLDNLQDSLMNSGGIGRVYKKDSKHICINCNKTQGGSINDATRNEG